MSSSRAMEDLARAASAAGFAMAAIDDDYAIVPEKPIGEAVARGARIGSQLTTGLRDQSDRTDARGFVAGAQHVRETVFGYLGLGATA